MNKIFIVTHHDASWENEPIVVGSFDTRMSAILFVKYLMTEGVEGNFDIEMIESFSMDENINRYKENKSVTKLIATTLHESIERHGQIYLHADKKVIDLIERN